MELVGEGGGRGKGRELRFFSGHSFGYCAF